MRSQGPRGIQARIDREAGLAEQAGYGARVVSRIRQRGIAIGAVADHQGQA